MGREGASALLDRLDLMRFEVAALDELGQALVLEPALLLGPSDR